MRSLYIEPEDSFWKDSELKYSGIKLKHLTKVIRLKVNDSINIFDGLGKVYLSQVESLNKGYVHLNKIEEISFSPAYNISVGIGIVKKDAMERCLRSCIEMGISKIVLFETDYSQKQFEWKNRHEAIIESAMEQANFYIKPSVTFEKNLKNFNYDGFTNKLIMTTEKPQSLTQISRSNDLLMFGPEGGWSSSELEFFEEIGGIYWRTEGPIMRTPTAISAAVGFYQARTLNC